MQKDEKIANNINKNKLIKNHKQIDSKKNIRLYPIYTMFAYDLLFFYGVRMLFLTDVKGIADYQVVFSLSEFAIFTVIMQWPSTLLISKIGNRNGAILGNILNVIWGVLFIFIRDYKTLLLVTIITATANSLKNVSDTNILNDSIPESPKKSDIFTSIDKRSYYEYCILSAISTIFAGYLYEINPYIPMFFCLVCSIIATIISFNFDDVKEEKTISIYQYISELKHGFKYTIKSKRMQALLLSTGVAWGIIVLLGIYQLSLLQSIGVKSAEIGIIFAVLELIKGLYSKKAIQFNNTFKNRSLTNILLTFGIGFILSGVVAILNINLGLKLSIIIVIFFIIGAINGIFLILAKRYLNSFASDKILISIYAERSISDNLARTIITAIGSYILTICNIYVAMIIVGFIILIGTFLLSIYMKNKLGIYNQKNNKLNE